MMGRKKSTCIQYFDLTKDDLSRCEKAKCKFCGWASAKNTVRMKIHLAKGCSECPVDVKNTYLDQLDDDDTEDSEALLEADSEEIDLDETLETSRGSEKHPRRTTGHKSPKRKKRKSVPLRSTVAEDSKEIDRALADFLFAANLPISIVESPFFVAFCKKMRPSYNLPSRHRVISQGFFNGATPVGSLPANFLQSPFAVNTIPIAIPQGGMGGAQPLIGGVAIHGGPHQVPAGEMPQFPGGYQILNVVTSGP